MDFVWLIVGTAVGIAILVFLAVQLSSSVADRISMEKEVELVDNQFGWKGKEGNTPPTAGTQAKSEAKDLQFADERRQLQSLVDQLWLPFSPEASLHLRSSIDPAPFENAYMGLGGRMAVTTGLLENSESENELGFVICHEIGHFVHRDVIRGLSTRFMLMAALSLLGLSDNNLGVVNLGVDSSLLSYSRDQESKADEFAVSCASQKYGHIEGFDTFFVRATKKNPKILDNKFFQYMSTHPISEERIKHLRDYASIKGVSPEGPLTQQTLWKKKAPQEAQ